MKVSIIIPTTRRYEHFVTQAEDSARNQSIPVHVWKQPASNLNVAQATNIGAASSRSEYLMRLDCDDFLHEMAAEIMSNYLDNNPGIAAVYSDYWEVDEEGRLGPFTGYVTNSIPPHPGCMMIRRKAFEQVRGFDVALTRQEGTDFYYRLTKDHSVAHLTLPLWYYRRHGKQASNAHNEVVKARHEVKDLHKEGTERIMAVIPARGGSKGIPRKNLVNLNGKPLVTHAIRMAKSSTLDMLVAVSTEDDEIREVAEAEGVTIIARDPEDAKDDVDLITVAKHSMEAMDGQFRADIVVTIQPTAPWTPVTALDDALIRLILDPKLEAVVSMSEVMGKHPFRMYSRVEDRRYVPFFPESSEFYLQRQDRPTAYQFTGGFYARRRKLLEEWDGKGFALGDWEGELVPPQAGIDIDTRFDLWLAEAILAHREQL